MFVVKYNNILKYEQKLLSIIFGAYQVSETEREKGPCTV